MNIRLRVDGGTQLAKALADLPTRASANRMRAALRTTAAEPIQRAAERNAPRAPGAPDLASHIVISTGKAGPGAASLVVGPSSEIRSDGTHRTEPLPYSFQGMYLEFGTSDTPAQPFLRPAFD